MILDFQLAVLLMVLFLVIGTVVNFILRDYTCSIEFLHDYFEINEEETVKVFLIPTYKWTKAFYAVYVLTQLFIGAFIFQAFVYINNSISLNETPELTMVISALFGGIPLLFTELFLEKRFITPKYLFKETYYKR